MRSAALLTAIVLTAAGCARTSQQVLIQVPATAKLETAAVQRVLVAGFVSGGSEEDVDVAQETVGVFRSQLRRNTEWTVIDAAPLTLADPGSTPDGPSLEIDEESDLDDYDPLFTNVDYWRRIGEEFQEPLIVTGTAFFRSYTPSPSLTANRPLPNPSAGPQLALERQIPSAYLLHQRVVFIDGRTGRRMHTESMRRAVIYEPHMNPPALAAYFELMDRLMPQFLNTTLSRKVAAPRTLLK
jgi:hypothetical protein